MPWKSWKSRFTGVYSVFFGTGNSKVFENVLRTKELSRFCLHIIRMSDEAMNDKEILSQVYLEGIRPGACHKGKFNDYTEWKGKSLGSDFALWNGAQHGDTPACGDSGTSGNPEDYNGGEQGELRFHALRRKEL